MRPFLARTLYISFLGGLLRACSNLSAPADRGATGQLPAPCADFAAGPRPARSGEP